MPVSDLEEQLNQQGRSAKVEEVAKEIERLGVKYLYFHIVSITGRVLGKVVPAAHFRRIAEDGTRMHPAAIADVSATRAGRLIGADPDSAEMVVMPDLTSFRVLPWDPEYGRFFCFAYESSLSDRPGAALEQDPRGNLKRQVETFQRDLGLEPMSGCEPEMSWFRPGDETGGLKVDAWAPGYHIGHLEEMREVVKRVMGYAQAMGLDMIQGDYEDFAQLELNFAFGNFFDTADRLTTYRQVCAQVARETGFIASFMPKPIAGRWANGCHHNLSLWRDGKNAFADEAKKGIHLNELGKQALAGLLEHDRGMTAVLASTANSYARLWDVGAFAPSTSSWGYDNKTCSVRVTGGPRLEHKTADASVNPYLSHAVILHAMRDGIERKLDPGAPQQVNVYEGTDGEARLLPKTLADALDLLSQDKVVREALPGKLYEIFDACKRNEWELMMAAVTDWHREMYLNAIP